MNKDLRLSSAIHILIALHHVGRPLNSATLAMSLRTNPGFIRRILAQLSKAGFVKTEKGKGGGTSLALDPAKINIGDIYRALGHNRIFKSFEKPPFEQCPVSCGIKESLDSVYADIESGMLAHMRTITLKQVIRRMGR